MVASVNDPADFLESYRYAIPIATYSQWSNAQFSELLSKAEQCTVAEQRMTYGRSGIRSYG